MPRPLTAADRSPQVGDVVIDTRRPYWPRTIEDVSDGTMYFIERRGRGWYSLKNAEWWHYISRADNGPVIVEG